MIPTSPLKNVLTECCRAKGQTYRKGIIGTVRTYSAVREGQAYQRR